MESDSTLPIPLRILQLRAFLSLGKASSSFCPAAEGVLEAKAGLGTESSSSQPRLILMIDKTGQEKDGQRTIIVAPDERVLLLLPSKTCL